MKITKMGANKILSDSITSLQRLCGALELYFTSSQLGEIEGKIWRAIDRSDWEDRPEEKEEPAALQEEGK